MEALQKQYGRGVAVASVEGSDVFLRYKNGPDLGADAALRFLVVVARGGELAAASKQRLKLKPAQQSCTAIVEAGDGGVAEASSTKLREAMRRGDKAGVEELCGSAAIAEALMPRGAACLPS